MDGLPEGAVPTGVVSLPKAVAVASDSVYGADEGPEGETPDGPNDRETLPVKELGIIVPFVSGYGIEVGTGSVVVNG
jgi:hypothetical protein